MGKGKPNNTELICSYPECNRKTLAKGWCSSHYKQVVLGGRDPKPILATLPLLQRLMSRVIKTDSCWLWNGATNDHGYGLIGNKSHILYVHRVVFEIDNNIKLNDNQEVCHNCDVPNCVRPEHLFLAGHAINMLDMAVKGRAANKKLSDSQVIEIRRLKPIFSYKELADMFCVSKSSIKDIISGRNYYWLK